MLHALANNLFENLPPWKWGRWDIFSASAVTKNCLSHSQYIWKNKSNINGLSYWIVFYTVSLHYISTTSQHQALMSCNESQNMLHTEQQNVAHTCDWRFSLFCHLFHVTKHNVSPGDYKLFFVWYIDGAWYFNNSYMVRVFKETSLMVLNFYSLDIFNT